MENVSKMKLLKLFRRISPEWLFLSLLAVLLTAVALLYSYESYWSLLPLVIAMTMILAVVFNDEPERHRQEPNNPAQPDQKTYSSQQTEGIVDRTIQTEEQSRTIDPENLSRIQKNYSNIHN